MKKKESGLAAGGPDLKDTGRNPISNFPLKSDYRDCAFEYWPRPSEWELAQLAARLARTERIDSKALVAAAWELYWESCRTIQTDYLKVQTHFEQEAKKAESGNAQEAETLSELPVPKRYPVSYPELELLLLPKLKGRTAERARIMREFMFQDYVASRSAPMKVAPGIRPEVLTAAQLIRLREESTAELARRFGQLRATSFGVEDYATCPRINNTT